MIKKYNLLKFFGIAVVCVAVVGCKAPTENEYREDINQAFEVLNGVSMKLMYALEDGIKSCDGGNFGYKNVTSCKIEGNKGSIEIKNLNNTKLSLLAETTTGSYDMTCTLSDKKASDLFNTNDCFTMFNDNSKALMQIDK